MLKLIYSMAELNAGQLLDIYKEHKWDEMELLSYLREDFFSQKGAFYAVWVVDGVYKSAVRLESYRDGLLLHSLETAPNARRRGYAYNLLMGVLEHLQNTDTKAVYAHVKKSNRASQNLHMKCGFRIIADTATYLDGTVTQYANTLCIQL